MKSFRELVSQESSSSYERTRVEDNTMRPATWVSHWYKTQSPTPTPDPVSNYRVGTWRSMDDIVTPRFKQISGKGGVVNNKMSSTFVSCEVQPGGFNLRIPNTTTPPIYYDIGAITGAYFLPNINSVTSIMSTCIASCEAQFGAMPNRSNLIGLASTAARSKIEQPAFTGLVSIGELRETLSYLRNPFKAGLKLADTLERESRRIAKGKPSQVASDLASLYLEFRYAVRPMIFEVEKGLDALRRDTTFRPIRKTARAKEGDKVQASKVSTGVTSGINYTKTESFSREIAVRCGFLYEDVVDPGLSATWGMRLSDIPAALWELTPLSFVYDWFGNMGDFISAITPVGGLVHKGNWTTITTTNEYTLVHSNVSLVNWTTVSQTPCSMTLKVVNKERYPTVNLPSLEWRGFDKVTSDALKVLDLIGITKQKLDNSITAPALEQHKLVTAGKRFDKRINAFK